MNKGRRFPPRPVTRIEAARMAGAARSARDCALMIVLWKCGLRNAELCALRMDELSDTANGGLALFVARGKGEKSRLVGIEPGAASFLRIYLSQRGPAPGCVFLTNTGAPLHTNQVRRTVKSLASRAAVGRRVHPHALRHTFAAELYEETRDVRLIQVALGHSSLDATMVYLQSIGANQVLSVLTDRKEFTQF